MDIYPYTIKLIDPLFYSHEALSGAFTPAYLHATAVNHAVAWSMGRIREDQSYIISDQTGGRNIPRYQNSWIEPDFYFTPAAAVESIDYMVETVKGDMDYLIQPGFGQAKISGKNIGRNEVLKAYRIFSIPPETEFKGYLHVDPDIVEKIPSCIRLGSFRGKADLKIGNAEKILGRGSNEYVNHPVDPLISKVKRGVMISMFPYPIVESAFVEDTWEIRHLGRREYIAIPAHKLEYDSGELLKRLENLKPGISKAKDIALPLKDRAYLILHMLRTALSIRFFLIGISGEERLDAALKELIGIENVRMASKGESIHVDQHELYGLIEKIGVIIDDCEEKIKGETKSGKSKGTGGGSSGVIL